MRRPGGREWSFTLWRELTSMSGLRNKQIDANKWRKEGRKKETKKQKNRSATVGNETDGLRESTRCCVGGLFNWWYHISLSLFSLLLVLPLSFLYNAQTHTLTLMHTIFALSPPYPCMTHRPCFSLLRFAHEASRFCEPTKTSLNQSLPAAQQSNAVHIVP